MPVFFGLLEAKDLSPQRFCEEASLGLESFISGVLKQDYEGIENKALLVAAQTLGPEKTGFLYAELVHSKMPSLPSACVDLLHTLTFPRSFVTRGGIRASSR